MKKVFLLGWQLKRGKGYFMPLVMGANALSRTAACRFIKYVQAQSLISRRSGWLSG
jgi:hypothetical protein